MTDMTDTPSSRGSGWLTVDAAPADVLTPESLGDDYRLMGRTAAEFVHQEVEPALEALEQKDWTVGRTLLARAGELGLLGTDAPDAVGGVGLDKAAATVVAEAIGANAAFSTMFGAQAGLATIPLLCFGTEAQQQRYLPALLAGERVGAYCLSESGSGSDALSLRTRARQDADGTWRLDGEKMWITNGGFADVFIVFAKVDGERVTAFIVERSFPGVSAGQEEHKMGLHGSSTTPLVLADARVPAENLLGEVGRGHKIAFNVLNYGRFKLGAMCSGGAKAALAEAAGYAATRQQFGRPIASFGAIAEKLATMAVRLYATEAVLYRVAGLIDAQVAGRHDDPGVVAAALEEFAVEASMLKVAGSEMMDFVVDENVQIHGGNGFVRDYPAERRYRDARVNRIFEGTNEINRLLIPGRILKLADAAGAAPGAASPAGADHPSGQPDLDAAHDGARALKATAREALAAAAARFGRELSNEQEVLMRVADLLIEAFLAESAVLRAKRAHAAEIAGAGRHADVATLVVHDALHRAWGLSAIVDRATAGEASMAPGRLAAAAAAQTADPIAARRRVAEAVVSRKAYPFA